MAKMKKNYISVLLIEDSGVDTKMIKEILKKSQVASFNLRHVETISDAMTTLDSEEIDIILLDLYLPGTRGMETINKIYKYIHRIPVVLLTGFKNETFAAKTIQMGVQDYLVKGEFDSIALERSIRYAIERHKLHAEMQDLVLVDELTGLYNRRGFFTLAEQQIGLSRKTDRGFLVIYADLDNMKYINDTYGHQEGDAALKLVADLFRDTFRAGDIIARMGGDEFLVLAIDAFKEYVRVIRTRLEDNLADINTRGSARYKLSLSTGEVYFDPRVPNTIDDLLAVADKRLYEHKKTKQNGGREAGGR